MDRTEVEQEVLKARFTPKLHAELRDLDALSQSTTEDRAPVELDQQSVGRLSRMDAIQVQAMAQAADRRRQLRRAQIRAALRRLDEGEFGYCQTCGDFIGLSRLDVDPVAPSCIACAKAAAR